jgi:hypothetical protein
MTVEEVKSWVEKIKAMAGDSEVAHAEEDQLYLAVLTAIRDGECEDPQALASEALEAASLDFERWCA